jgi:hypothetical protein
MPRSEEPGFCNEAVRHCREFPGEKIIRTVTRLGKLRRFENNNKTEIYDLCEVWLNVQNEKGVFSQQFVINKMHEIVKTKAVPFETNFKMFHNTQSTNCKYILLYYTSPSKQLCIS